MSICTDIFKNVAFYFGPPRGVEKVSAPARGTGNSLLTYSPAKVFSS